MHLMLFLLNLCFIRSINLRTLIVPSFKCLVFILLYLSLRHRHRYVNLLLLLMAKNWLPNDARPVLPSITQSDKE